MWFRSALACALTVASLVPAVASGRPPATLRVVQDLPLTLVGTSFRPHERATVTIRIGGYSSLTHVRASSAGRFTLRLRGVRLNYCAQPLSIVARGTRSGVVNARLRMGECAAP